MPKLRVDPLLSQLGVLVDLVEVKLGDHRAL